jgi:hypothetical protein
MRGQAGADTLVYDADDAVGGGGGGGGAGGAHLPTLEYDAVAVAAPVAAPLTSNGAASKAAAKAVQSKGDAGNNSAPGNP